MEIRTETVSHRVADAEVELLGAYRTVTGAMTRLATTGGSLLFDCGVAQGREARDWSLPEAALDVQGIVLTHGHNDHVGSLPAVLERGYSGPILGTPATLEIADIVLRDGIRLQGGSDREVAAFRRRFRALQRPVPYDRTVSVDGVAAELTLREAGHILGSASVEIRTGASRLVLSGDLGRPASPLLRDPWTGWAADRPVDLVVMESTYGDRAHRQSHGDVERELERIVNTAVADGGHILVPAFAIGRTQTLIYHLNTLVESGRVRGLPVAIDTPMGLQVTRTYEKHQRLFDREALAKIAAGDDPLDFDELYAVNKGGDSVRLRDVEESMLVIAGSGMCTGGRIVGHLKALLPRPETCVLFVGYQAQGTPGRAIQRAAGSGGTVRLDGEDVPVRAHIETLGGLSAHADRDELASWLGTIPSVRALALHHGEPEAQAALASFLRGRGGLEGRPGGGLGG